MHLEISLKKKNFFYLKMVRGDNIKKKLENVDKNIKTYLSLPLCLLFTLFTILSFFLKHKNWDKKHKIKWSSGWQMQVYIVLLSCLEGKNIGAKNKKKT